MVPPRAEPRHHRIHHPINCAPRAKKKRHRGGRSNLADQLARAALAIVNNLAEGAGRFSKPDKSRFYTTAIGSATESAAMLDVCLRRQLVSIADHERGKQLLERIVAMLVKLCRTMRDG